MAQQLIGGFAGILIGVAILYLWYRFQCWKMDREFAAWEGAFVQYERWLEDRDKQEWQRVLDIIAPSPPDRRIAR